MKTVTTGGNRGGRTTALLDDLLLSVLNSTTRQGAVTADPAIGDLLRGRLGDLADVHVQEHAPRGCVLLYPADMVPTFRPRPPRPTLIDDDLLGLGRLMELGR